MVPIVLAPGLLCDRRVWAPLQARLPQTALDVEFAQASDLQDMAAAILAAAPQSFVLLGHSMGAMAAVLAAAQAPDRVAGLLLCNTHAERETPERKARRARQLALAMSGQFRSHVVDDLKPLYFAPGTDRAPERQTVGRMAIEAGEGQFRRHVLALMSRPDPRPLLGRLTMPVTVVGGRGDEIVPLALVEALARAIPHARLVIAEDSGHMTPLEAPDLLADELRRLAVDSTEAAA